MSLDTIHQYAWPNATKVHPMPALMACNASSFNYSTSGCIPVTEPADLNEEGSVDDDDAIATYISIFLLMVFGAVGIVGNGTLVFIVALNREMRNVPNVLIASLALGDFLFLLVSVPFTVISYLNASFIFSESMCKLISMLPVLSEGVSVFTLAAMSHDRYTAIVKPMDRRKSSTAARTYIVAASIWIISTLLSIPSLILSYLEDTIDAPNAYCFYLPHNTISARIHETLRCTIMFVIPLVFISVYYVIIAMKLLESSHMIPGAGGLETGQVTKQVRARRRLARTVLVLVVIFGLCWLPHFIYRLWFQYNLNVEFFMTTGMYYFQLLSNLLPYFNSCINPVALCFLSNTYRKYYMKYLCCRHGGNNDNRKGTPYKLSENPKSKRLTDDSFRNSSAETKTCTV